jgi:hypothetical protein
MRPADRPDLRCVVILVCLTLWLPGKVSVWIDDQGQAVLTNRESPPAAGAAEIEPAALAERWRGDWLGEPVRAARADDVTRAVATIRDDWSRGERARALESLPRLQAAHPARPEIPVLLARIEAARGRLPAALAAVDAALALVTAEPAGWREDAERLRGHVAQELAHADTLPSRDGSREAVQASPHFRLVYDHPFAGRPYGERVIRALESVRDDAYRALGRALPGPLDVRLYTRAEYLAEHSHRFGFDTVGFYDGAIHVVATRQPERRLVALLAHEHAHALFKDALGSHMPYFLNEGIAEREEGRLHGRERLVRGEWRRMLEGIRAQQWIPLDRLVSAFNRLDAQQVPLAYLEARAAVEVLEDRQPGVIGRWLARCAAGTAWRAALREESGFDVAALDTELQAAVAARFAPVDAVQITPARAR